ncbi:Gfo/Idh/MocA family oxidoreductase [Streptomyces bacillaris]|uniref:Gfo/Idh/MocA family protein n=1 Tax=Streptomyces bacillaris TaxID=68179 RepID=UPI00335B2DE9
MGERATAPPLRIGLVGHGWWAERYLLPPLLAMDEVRVPSLCGRSEERAAAAARANGIPESFTDLETMLDAVELDALVVASPPSTHLAAVTAAASRGLHVFCEKPLARDATETGRMVEACTGVRTLVGFTQRWHPAVATLHRLVTEGHIGDVRHLRYMTRAALSGDPSAPWSWRYDAREYAYGVLSDLGPHAVDLVRLIGGEVVSVSAAAQTIVAERPGPDGRPVPVGNWDDCTATLELDSDITASLVMSRSLPPNPYRRFHHELDVIGSEGTVTFTSDRPTEVVQCGAGQQPLVVPADGLDTVDTAPGSFEEIMLVHRAGAARQAADMIAAFTGADGPGLPTMADGHRGQQVLDHAARSAREGRWVRCP